MGAEEARGGVSQDRGSRTVVGDLEQLAVEEAAGEGLTLMSLAVGPGSEKVLNKEGKTVDQTLGLDGDVEH